MAKVFQAVGILLALGVAADLGMGTGMDRDYGLNVITDGNGNLDVAKVAHDNHYVLGHRHRTRWAFTNKTNPPVSADVRLAEPGDCHVDFKPGNGCKSNAITLAPNQSDSVDAKAPHWNQVDCRFIRCGFNMQVKLTNQPESAFRNVDPDLQIDRDYFLSRLGQAVLLVIAVVLVTAPIILDFIRRRGAGPAS